MPFRAPTRFELRVEFMVTYISDLYDFTDLCDLYGVSRPTGYKWVERFEIGGYENLHDLSHAPRSCPHQTTRRIEEMLVGVRRKHPYWGSKKILNHLERRKIREDWPVPSTVGTILKRNGLVQERKRRRKIMHPGKPVTLATAPNQLWAADFKGQFKTLDGIYCYPLTVSDQHSRFLLGCQGLASTSEVGAKPVFESLFREYGLPEAIRTDNGAPFATTAIGRLSRLSVWWIKLGIRPELIEPAHPEQNGRHERMHKTLKQCCTIPPGANLAAQQRKFDGFRREYNEERPHESLGQLFPAEVYTSSPRPFPSVMPPIEYPPHFEVRRVSRNGGIRWKTGWVSISHALLEERVGLEEIDDGIWSLYFGPMLLGRFDETERTLYGVRNQYS